MPPLKRGRGKAAVPIAEAADADVVVVVVEDLVVENDDDQENSGDDDSEEWTPSLAASPKRGIETHALSHSDQPCSAAADTASSSDSASDAIASDDGDDVLVPLPRRRARKQLQGSARDTNNSSAPVPRAPPASQSRKRGAATLADSFAAAATATTTTATVATPLAAGVQGLAADDADDANDFEDDPPKPAKKARPAAKSRKQAETTGEKVARFHPEIDAVWEKLATNSSSLDVLAPIAQPRGLVTPLLPFQARGVAWMLRQEQSSFSGGLLSDDMGLGKTIQTLALMVSTATSAPTLVVVPAVALHQWAAEIRTHVVPDRFQVVIHHGATRGRDAALFTKPNTVVLTTYSCVETEFRRQQSGFTRKGEKVKESSTLHAWGRIVLDEAHNIKERSGATARAVFHLRGTFKWSLSGTPVQNRVGDLYSLVKFMQADPYSFYFCKQCDCKSLHWKFTQSQNCDDCGHKSYSHFCWWNREILKPIMKFGNKGVGATAYARLGVLLRSIMLRRTKVELVDQLGLPPRVVHTRRDLFNDQEEDFYTSLFADTQTKFEAFVRQGTILNNYAHIFELLMRMRQAVNHPWLVTHRGEGPQVNVCGICHEPAEDAIISACKHTFCREDIRLYLESSSADEGATQCPVCFRALTIDLGQPSLQADDDADADAGGGFDGSAGENSGAKKKKPKRVSIVSRLDFERWQSSSKIDALMEELTRQREKDPTIKSVVFSQFTAFLDLIEWCLKRNGMRCVKLDGRMSPAHRATVIEAFSTQPEIIVFLISLKAGGVALNLTAASRVFLCDTWWNPAVEMQASDRIHRLGQHRPVLITRLIVENSIESRIVQLQEKKHLLFESTVGMDESALNKLSEDDLQFLFVL